MQVGSTVWNGDKAGVVLVSDENGVTVGYFAEVETLTSDSDNPSPLSSAGPTLATVPEPLGPVEADVTTDEPPAPADKPGTESAGTSEDADPLNALTADERATFARLQGKVDAASSGA